MTYKDNCGLRKSDFTGVSTPSVLPVLYIIPRPRYTKKWRRSDFTGVSTPSVLPVLYIIPRPRYTKKWRRCPFQ